MPIQRIKENVMHETSETHIMLQMCTKTAMEHKGFECSVQTGTVRIFCSGAKMSVQHGLLREIPH